MKKILIIGATSSIAHACARLWAVQGATMYLVARDAEKLGANAADLRVRSVQSWNQFEVGTGTGADAITGTYGGSSQQRR